MIWFYLSQFDQSFLVCRARDEVSLCKIYYTNTTGWIEVDNTKILFKQNAGLTCKTGILIILLVQRTNKALVSIETFRVLLIQG